MAPMTRPQGIFHRSSPSNVSSHEDDNLARVFVGRGEKMKEFRVNKQKLSNAAPFFEDRLDATPAGVKVTPNQTPVPVWLPQQKSTIRLPNESASMFELFVVWLHQGDSFRRHLDEMITLVSDAPGVPCQRLHWALVRLHIFAARLDLHHLQDLAIDALQDIYLRCDWDVTPRFVEYVYGQCDAESAMRIRRWTVAMVAWSGAGGSSSTVKDDGGLERFQDMFERFPDFATEFTSHLCKMKSSKLDTRIKNPQLRIPANKLRNEERQFGFRQCSFHSHRAAVGERRCPHTTASRELDNFLLVPLVMEVAPEPSRGHSRRDIPPPPPHLRRERMAHTAQVF
ncbi:hypothetical protein CORC01_07700 [Colletotrichum orchidophilum]|uniref:BTB domain-containing protein n=1 Tax=Colletotrichum orchidophilum TaxID=1209926 RepID=A0A1G4B6J9_9PEZI|nr:uncharacterized protein CORC01_07700 [Colletotrichum orchidophilum]OHE96915.1 hypothetical protein CORC01_07700 [Colletotrichum orchidophilum]